MLSQERMKVLDLFRFPNGMMNVAWIAGYMRYPSESMFYIQQTNNENLLLPVYLKKKDRIPFNFEEYAPIRAICYSDGETVDNGERIAKMTVARIDIATVLDMPMDSAFEKIPPKGVVISDPRTEGFRPFSGQNDKMSDSSNMVWVAGFVQAASHRPASENKRACCTVLIRQHEDEARSIPVRFYDKLAKPVYDRLMRGRAIQVVGHYRVDVKVIGEPDPETGIAPVAKFPYIECRENTPPGPATGKEIKVFPAWAEQMYAEFQAKRAEAAPKSRKEARAVKQSMTVVTGGAKLEGSDGYEGDANLLDKI